VQAGKKNRSLTRNLRARLVTRKQKGSEATKTRGGRVLVVLSGFRPMLDRPMLLGACVARAAEGSGIKGASRGEQGQTMPRTLGQPATRPAGKLHQSVLQPGTLPFLNGLDLRPKAVKNQGLEKTEGNGPPGDCGQRKSEDLMADLNSIYLIVPAEREDTQAQAAIKKT